MTKTSTECQLISIQYACEDPLPVSEETIIEWVDALLKKYGATAEVNIRFVNTSDITELNHTYRHKNSPTNVLAFPFAKLPDNIMLDNPILGDVIISPYVVKQESGEQNKEYIEHFAHIVTHGVLHLLGFDHEEEEEAKIMQQHEIQFLHDLGFSNPYRLEGQTVE